MRKLNTKTDTNSMSGRFSSSYNPLGLWNFAWCLLQNYVANAKRHQILIETASSPQIIVSVEHNIYNYLIIFITILHINFHFGACAGNQNMLRWFSSHKFNTTLLSMCCCCVFAESCNVIELVLKTRSAACGPQRSGNKFSIINLLRD